MEKNIILLVVITAVAFFVVGNPITYGIMSKITGLKVKNKKTHDFVIIHSVVMTSLCMLPLIFNKDKECPHPRRATPPPKHRPPAPKKTMGQSPTPPAPPCTKEPPGLGANGTNVLIRSRIIIVEGFK